MKRDERWASIYQHLSHREYQLAVDDLKNIYELTPAKRINQLLVRTLLDAGDYRQAKEYLLERIDDYQSNTTDFKLMLRVLILNQNFIQAHIFINTVKSDSLRVSLQNDLQLAETSFLNENQSRVNQVVKSFYHIADHKLNVQQQLLADTMNLPVRSYLVGAKGALMDPFLLPAIRFNILDLLRELQVDQIISFQWLDDQMHQLQLKTLRPLAMMESTGGIFSLLANRFEQNAPMTFQNLTKTFKLFLAYLYPFNDKVVVDYKTWVEVAYQLQMGNRLDPHQLDPRVAQIYQWQMKLLKLVASIK